MMSIIRMPRADGTGPQRTIAVWLSLAMIICCTSIHAIGADQHGRNASIYVESSAIISETTVYAPRPDSLSGMPVLHDQHRIGLRLYPSEATSLEILSTIVRPLGLTIVRTSAAYQLRPGLTASIAYHSPFLTDGASIPIGSTLGLALDWMHQSDPLAFGASVSWCGSTADHSSQDLSIGVSMAILLTDVVSATVSLEIQRLILGGPVPVASLKLSHHLPSGDTTYIRAQSQCLGGRSMTLSLGYAHPLR